MEKVRASVRIAGQEFKLTSSDSEEHVQKLAAYVNKMIADVQEAYPSVSTSNCVLLASLNMADELFKLRADFEALDSRIKELREMPRSAAPVKRPFETKQTVTAE